MPWLTINGTDPKILAHVTEKNDGVIGFMVEMVPARHATIGDLAACVIVRAPI